MTTLVKLRLYNDGTYFHPTQADKNKNLFESLLYFVCTFSATFVYSS